MAHSTINLLRSCIRGSDRACCHLRIPQFWTSGRSTSMPREHPPGCPGRDNHLDSAGYSKNCLDYVAKRSCRGGKVSDLPDDRRAVHRAGCACGQFLLLPHRLNAQRSVAACCDARLPAHAPLPGDEEPHTREHCLGSPNLRADL